MTTIIDGKAAASTVIATAKAPNATLEAESGSGFRRHHRRRRSGKPCLCPRQVSNGQPAETAQEQPAALVATLNADPSIHGILVQLPLPTTLKSESGFSDEPTKLIRTRVHELSVIRQHRREDLTAENAIKAS